jgi:hypothetical protein
MYVLQNFKGNKKTQKKTSLFPDNIESSSQQGGMHFLKKVIIDYKELSSDEESQK